MGIQDRDYYRDDEPSWWADAARSRVTYSLMLLITAVFVAQVLGSDPRQGKADALLPGGLFDYAAILRGQVWRLLTSFFVHRREALVLVGLTVWAFYYFGGRVEARYGPVEYAVYLVLTALTISAAKLVAGGLATFEVDVPTFGSLPLLWSVLVLFVCVSPRTQLLLGLNVPTVLLALMTFGLTLGLDLEGGPNNSGVVAPSVGAVWSLIYFKLEPRLARRLRFDRVLGVARIARPPRLKLFGTPAETTRERDAATDQAARELLGAYARPASAPPVVAALDEQLEAKLDQVLEKVSRSGKDSLTGDEQNILRRASEIYKQRRGN